MNLYIVGVGQFYDIESERIDDALTQGAPSYQRAVGIQSGLRVQTGFGRSEAQNATIQVDNKGSRFNAIAPKMFALAEIRNKNRILFKGSVVRIIINASIIRLVIVN